MTASGNDDGVIVGAGGGKLIDSHQAKRHLANQVAL